MKKHLGLLVLTGVCGLAACSPPSIPAAQVQQLADLAPVIVKAAEPAPLILPIFPVQPPVTFGGPDPLKCVALITQEAGRQVVKLEAGNINCPPQDSGRAPIWLDFSKDGRLIVSYGLWVDNGSRASAEVGVTISRGDGGLIR